MFTKKVFHFIAASAVLAAACSKTETAKVDTTTPSATPGAAPSTAASTAPAADSMILVRGAITSVTATQVVVKTDSATVTVNTPQPVHVFTRGPSDLSHVTPNSFIGVTTVKQPDGTEKATEIHIFPDELRGLGEGSRMMNPPANGSGSAGSRMTNGAVSNSKMTNGAASTMTNGTAGAKMSNGAVSSTNGTTLVVSFPGGTTTAMVPPKTPIMEIKATDKKLAAGDMVVVVATKGADGNLSSQKVLLSK
jgi:hypothetical protein